MALVSDYTSIEYNSYVDLVELDTLIEGLSGVYPTTKWDALTDPQKESVARQAVNDFNSFDYKGTLNPAVISPFNMKYPRIGATYCNGVTIPSDVIPQFAKDYEAMRCLEILDNTLQDANNQLVQSNIKRNKLGGLEQEFFSPRDMAISRYSLDKFASYQIIECYVAGYGNGIFKQVIRR